MTVDPVDAADVAFLRLLDTATVADALALFGPGAAGGGAIGPRVRNLFPEQPPMVGQALTVSLANAPGTTSDYWTGFWAVFDALERMPGPSVIVAQDRSGGPSRFACSGDVVAELGLRLRAVGYVTDASVRDLDQVRPMGFAFFAAGVCVSHADFRYEDVGEDVVIGGQPVRTGDLLHGDANGLVVVPRKALPGLREAVAAARARTDRARNLSRSGSVADAAAAFAGGR